MLKVKKEYVRAVRSEAFCGAPGCKGHMRQAGGCVRDANGLYTYECRACGSRFGSILEYPTVTVLPGSANSTKGPLRRLAALVGEVVGAFDYGRHSSSKPWA